jgi:hypothetical protein
LSAEDLRAARGALPDYLQAVLDPEAYEAAQASDPRMVGEEVIEVDSATVNGEKRRQYGAQSTTTGMRLNPAFYPAQRWDLRNALDSPEFSALINDPEFPQFMALADPYAGNGNILDAGTHLGDKALSMAMKQPQARVLGIDYQMDESAASTRHRYLTEVNSEAAGRVELRPGRVDDLLPGEASTYSEVHVMAPPGSPEFLIAQSMRLVDAGGRLYLHTESADTMAMAVARLQKAGWLTMTFNGKDAGQAFIPGSRSAFEGPPGLEPAPPVEGSLLAGYAGENFYSGGVLAVRPTEGGPYPETAIAPRASGLGGLVSAGSNVLGVAGMASLPGDTIANVARGDSGQLALTAGLLAIGHETSQIIGSGPGAAVTIGVSAVVDYNSRPEEYFNEYDTRIRATYGDAAVDQLNAEYPKLAAAAYAGQTFQSALGHAVIAPVQRMGEGSVFEAAVRTSHWADVPAGASAWERYVLATANSQGWE